MNLTINNITPHGYHNSSVNKVSFKQTPENKQTSDVFVYNKPPQHSLDKKEKSLKFKLLNFYINNRTKNISGKNENSQRIYKRLIKEVLRGDLPIKILNGWTDSDFDEKFLSDTKLYLYAQENNLSEQQKRDLFVPPYKSVQEGMNQTQNGDLFEVDGKSYLKIDDKSKYELKISKDTYLNLFPPINYSLQGKAGDCYLLSAMISMWNNPNYKPFILNCFSENENGELQVKFPYHNSVITTDLKGTLPEDRQQNKQYYAQGSNGIKLLEALYEDVITRENNRKIIHLILSHEVKKMFGSSEEETVTPEQQKEIEILNSLNSMENDLNPEYVLSDNKTLGEALLEFPVEETKEKKPYFVYKFQDIKTKNEGSNINIVENPQIFYRSTPGNVIDVYKKFGLSGIYTNDGVETLYKLKLAPYILDYITKASDEFVYTASVKGNDDGNQYEYINREKGLLPDHSYALSIETNKKTSEPEYNLINPYNSSRIVKLNRDEMLKYVYSVGIGQN